MRADRGVLVLWRGRVARAQTPRPCHLPLPRPTRPCSASLRCQTTAADCNLSRTTFLNWRFHSQIRITTQWQTWHGFRSVALAQLLWLLLLPVRLSARPTRVRCHLRPAAAVRAPHSCSWSGGSVQRSTAVVGTKRHRAARVGQERTLSLKLIERHAVLLERSTIKVRLNMANTMSLVIMLAANLSIWRVSSRLSALLSWKESACERRGLGEKLIFWVKLFTGDDSMWEAGFAWNTT